MPNDRPEIVQQLSGMCRRVKGKTFNVELVTEEARLAEDLDLDSLDLLELRFDLESAWGLNLTDQEAMALEKVSDVVDHVVERVLD